MNKLIWIFAVAVTALALSHNAIAQAIVQDNSPQPANPQPAGGAWQMQQNNPQIIIAPAGQRGQQNGGQQSDGQQSGGQRQGWSNQGPVLRVGGGGMGIGGGIDRFLQNPEFAKMLELTPAQTEEIQKVVQDSIDNFRTTAFPRPEPGAPPPTPEEMRQRMDEIRKQMEKQVEITQAKVNQILKPEQQVKAKELAFQLTGGLDFPMLNVRTLETLDLTADQKEKIAKLTADRDEAFRTAMQGVDFRNQEAREKFNADREARAKKFTEDIKAHLTSEQKAKAEKLTAAAPELREKLGLPAPGQRLIQSGSGQERGQRGGPGGRTYTPGADSWRPGDPVPGAAPPPPSDGNRQNRQRGSFPRGESN
jgi:hypothetical protein